MKKQIIGALLFLCACTATTADAQTISSEFKLDGFILNEEDYGQSGITGGFSMANSFHAGSFTMTSVEAIDSLTIRIFDASGRLLCTPEIRYEFRDWMSYGQERHFYDAWIDFGIGQTGKTGGWVGEVSNWRGQIVVLVEGVQLGVPKRLSFTGFLCF